MMRRAVQMALGSSSCGVLGSSSGASTTAAAPALLLAGAAAARRAFAAAAADVVASTPAERQIAEKIAGGLPGAKAVRVEDTSGGCGTMYAIEVTASEFSGELSKIKQHQLVARLIADDVKQWHGFQLVTKAP